MVKKLHDFINAVDEAKAYTISFTLWPKLWKKALRRIRVTFSWKTYPFNSTSRANIPNSQGIYTFILNPNIAQHCCSYLMYVGVTIDQTLRNRFGQYLSIKARGEVRPRIAWLLNKYSDKNLFFCCAAFPSLNNLKQLEQYLIQAFVPPCNPQIHGKIGRIMRAF